MTTNRETISITELLGRRTPLKPGPLPHALRGQSVTLNEVYVLMRSFSSENLHGSALEHATARFFFCSTQDPRCMDMCTQVELVPKLSLVTAQIQASAIGEATAVYSVVKVVSSTKIQFVVAREVVGEPLYMCPRFEARRIIVETLVTALQSHLRIEQELHMVVTDVNSRDLSVKGQFVNFSGVERLNRFSDPGIGDRARMAMVDRVLREHFDTDEATQLKDELCVRVASLGLLDLPEVTTMN